MNSDGLFEQGAPAIGKKASVSEIGWCMKHLLDKWTRLIEFLCYKESRLAILRRFF